MKKILVLVFASITSYYFSQQKITVSDAETQKPIPYAKLILKGKDYYRNTEENGEITLEKDEEVSEIQSFGYENLLVQENKAKYFLKPRVIEIDEVTLVKPKFQKSFKIGMIKKSRMGFSASTKNWSVVDLFQTEISDEKLFIKKIKIPTKVVKSIKEATFNLIFYNNENGKPSKEINRSILVSCKTGKNITELDLSKSPIPLPKEGYFIGFEWIVNEQNKYTYITDINYPDGRLEKNVSMQGIAPSLSGYESTDSNIFALSNDFGWHVIFKNRGFNNTNYSLSIELEITD